MKDYTQKYIEWISPQEFNQLFANAWANLLGKDHPFVRKVAGKQRQDEV